jgi:hypothetical protein
MFYLKKIILNIIILIIFLTINNISLKNTIKQSNNNATINSNIYCKNAISSLKNNQINYNKLLELYIQIKKKTILFGKIYNKLSLEIKNHNVVTLIHHFYNINNHNIIRLIKYHFNNKKIKNILLHNILNNKYTNNINQLIFKTISQYKKMIKNHNLTCNIYIDTQLNNKKFNVNIYFISKNLYIKYKFDKIKINIIEKQNLKYKKKYTYKKYIFLINKKIKNLIPNFVNILKIKYNKLYNKHDIESTKQQILKTNNFIIKDILIQKLNDKVNLYIKLKHLYNYIYYINLLYKFKNNILCFNPQIKIITKNIFNKFYNLILCFNQQILYNLYTTQHEYTCNINNTLLVPNTNKIYTYNIINYKIFLKKKNTSINLIKLINYSFYFNKFIAININIITKYNRILSLNKFIKKFNSKLYLYNQDKQIILNKYFNFKYLYNDFYYNIKNPIFINSQLIIKHINNVFLYKYKYPSMYAFKFKIKKYILNGNYLITNLQINDLINIYHNIYISKLTYSKYLFYINKNFNLFINNNFFFIRKKMLSCSIYINYSQNFTINNFNNSILTNIVFKINNSIKYGIFIEYKFHIFLLNIKLGYIHNSVLKKPYHLLHHKILKTKKPITKIGVKYCY